jgi:hypothetical protein
MSKSILILFLIVAGCGVQPADAGKGAAKDGANEPGAVETIGETSERMVRLTGYIAPMNLVIDGSKFDDVEQFATIQLERLQGEATKSGLMAVIVGGIGVLDWKVGATAFIESRGFATEVGVDPTDGTFLADVPYVPRAKINVKTVKRIAVELIRADQTIVQEKCFNVSGTAHVNADADADIRIIVRSFSTQLTTYSCVVANRGGLSVPAPVIGVDTNAGDDVADNGAAVEAADGQ